MNREIPIFFTIDDGYAPFLAVALNSAIKNASSDRHYRAIVLHQDLNEANAAKLKSLETENEESKDMLSLMKESIGDKINAVRFTNKLKKHPVCITSEGGLSLEMEKTLNSMPGASDNKVKAQLVLEINSAHPITEKLKALYNDDKETLAKYAKLLYGEACLIGGACVPDPVEHSNLVCELMVK